MSSCILSLLSPVLRAIVCGNFRESICKEISLDDIEAERMLKLLHLACGKEQAVAEDIEELMGLGQLADRLQMEAVRSEIEKSLLKELNLENCLEMIQGSEASGLHLLQRGSYKMLQDNFEKNSHKKGFLKLSEETMGALLDEDELGTSREEDVFEAVVRWMSDSHEGARGVGLLRKIRYGVMSSEYLAGHMSSTSLPGLQMMKELAGEAMAKNGGAGCEGGGGCEGMWDGVERLCDKWIVARGMKGRIIGVDVLKRPGYVAMDGQGHIVVSDQILHAIIVFNHNGSILRRFGSEGSAAGQFHEPLGIAVDRHGHIVVADSGNHRIQVWDADGSEARCFGSEGTAVGQFKGPYGLAIDREGNIVVADHNNNRIQVFDGHGSVVRHFGSYGTAVGQLLGPTGVAVDGEGRIVVADECNHRVQVFRGDGSVALCFGSEGDGPGQLKDPEDVAVDSVGRIVVADTGNHRVQVFNLDGSMACVMGSEGDGAGELCEPFGVVVDGAGRVIVAEWGDNHRVQVL